MRKRATSAIEKAWRDVDKLVEKWNAEGWPEYEDEKPDRPTPSDAHYTDVSQLAQWRKENE